MLINISFYESANFTSDNVENLIPAIKKDITPKNISNIGDIGKELENIINDNYFGGANGAEYIGFDLDNEVFNYKLNPG